MAEALNNAYSTALIWMNPPPPTLLTAYQYFFSKSNFRPTVTGNQ